jgi:hypothetical protein
MKPRSIAESNLSPVARTKRHAIHARRSASILVVAVSAVLYGTACETELSCAETATCAPSASDGASDKDHAARDGSIDRDSPQDRLDTANDVRLNADGSDGARVDARTTDAGTSDATGNSRDAPNDSVSFDARTADTPGDASSDPSMDVASTEDGSSDVATPDAIDPDVSIDAAHDSADGRSTVDVVIGCDSTTCSTGCCNGSTCVPHASQSDVACGTGGAACAACGANRTCSAGACTAIADDIWAVGATGGATPTSVIIHWTKAAGWELQLSQGFSDSLHGVWGTDPANVWAVGSNGLILHFDGMRWTQVTSPTTQRLAAIWGSSRSDVWAVGYDAAQQRGLVIRYDGNAWVERGSISAWDNLTLTSICGTGPRDIWLVGAPNSGSNGSKIFHFGALGNWTDETAGGLTTWLQDIWVTSAAGWVVGRDPGTLLRLDGNGWTALNPSPTTSNLQDVSGSSANDVWAIGWYGLDTATEILHYDGSTWTPFEPATQKPLVTDLFVRSATDVWFVGFGGGIMHYDGVQLAPDATVPTLANLQAIWGVR